MTRINPLPYPAPIMAISPHLPALRRYARAATGSPALGDAVLFFAIAQASPAVACRARLRLPQDLSPESSPVPASLRDGHQALSLARGLLQELDAEWMSLFHNSP